MATEAYYKSIWEGKQIDDSIGSIVNGEIEDAAALAEASVKAAKGSEIAAAESARVADLSKSGAETAKVRAESANTAAQAAKSAAESAANTAASNAIESVRTEMTGYVTDAGNQANRSKAEADKAANSERNAKSSELNSNAALSEAIKAKEAAIFAQTKAEKAAVDSDTNANSAFLSKQAAFESATLSESSAQTSVNAKNDSLISQNLAETARQGAEDARSAIENLLVASVTLSTGQAATVTKELVDGVVQLVFGLPSGEKGDQGDVGASIDRVERTSGTGAPGTVDTYTITMTDGSTSIITVYNGRDGIGTGDMVKAVYDPQNKNTDIFGYTDTLVSSKQNQIVGQEGQIVGFDENGKPIAQAAPITAIPLAQKGSPGGVAELDIGGKVPSSRLPSYVDDVLEYQNKESFPVVGESEKIYVALDSNLTWRWSGTSYVEISPSIALGETSNTAYRGDRGKIAYDHSQTSGNPHKTTAADVGARPSTWVPTTDEIGLEAFLKMSKMIQDWNAVPDNGWYMGNNAPNSPPGDWFMGFSQRHNNGYCVQRVCAFASTHKWYERWQMDGAWSAWEEQRSNSWMPTAAEVGADPAGTASNAVAAHASKLDNPHAVTASQVGADPVGSAASAVASHNTAANPHSEVLYTKTETVSAATKASFSLAATAVSDAVFSKIKWRLDDITYYVEQRKPVFGTYTGTGSGSTQGISLGFTPSIVIIMERGGSSNRIWCQMATPEVDSEYVQLSGSKFTVKGEMNTSVSDYSNRNPFRYIAFR